MMKYPILIPSRGRSNSCDTVDNIPQAFRSNIWLFVIEEESDSYQRVNEARWGGEVHIVCASLKSDKISLKREKMVKYIKDKMNPEFFWMMDDDLKFFERRNEYVGDTRLSRITNEIQFQWMFDTLEGMAKPSFCAIGVSMRQGNNNLPPDGDMNSRLIRCGLYNTDVFLKAEHNRLRYMGDFDVMIQMLKMGYDNKIVAQYSQDHVGTNAKGGCSNERDEEAMEEVANKLAEFHPDCVTTRKKVNKKGKLAERTDVTIYWKKARRFLQK